MMELWIDKIPSAIGTILLVVEVQRLCALDYAGYEQRMLESVEIPCTGNSYSDTETISLPSRYG